MTYPVQFLRTPDERFLNLPDFPFEPQYTLIDGLRIAHIDEGPRDAPTVLLMHGEPTWSFLYRKMIPVLVNAGYRVLAPDLIGFGRSDKPTRSQDYTYSNHVKWMSAWLKVNDFQNITLFCQDWGSLIGLRMVTAHRHRFDAIVLANGGLPTGTTAVPIAFKIWQAFARFSPWFPIGRIVKTGCHHGLSKQEVKAYDAPYPSKHFCVGARAFPLLVPTTPDDPERINNEKAWAFFKKWHKPFLTLFSNRDPVTKGGERPWQELVPGAQGQAHATIRSAGHFLQEDKGVEVANALVSFMRQSAKTHKAQTI